MKLVVLDELRRPRSVTHVQLLILENQAEDVEPVLAELRASGYDVQYTLALNQEQFVAALQVANFDAILADYSLASWTGWMR